MYDSINMGPQCIVPVRWSSYHVAPLFLDLQTCTAQETVGHSVLCPCDGRATLWPSVSWSRYRLGARNTGACVVRIMLMPETMGHSVLYPCDGRATLWPLFLGVQTCTAQETVGHSVLHPCDGRATLWPPVYWPQYRIGARNMGTDVFESCSWRRVTTQHGSSFRCTTTNHRLWVL